MSIQPINSKGTYSTSTAQRKAYSKYRTKHETIVAYLQIGTKKEIQNYGYNPNQLLTELLLQYLDHYEESESKYNE